MIRLSARGNAVGIHDVLIGRVVLSEVQEQARSDSIRVVRKGEPSVPAGYMALLSDSTQDGCTGPTVSNLHCDHLTDGDIVSVEPNGNVRTLIRAESKHNTLFATERCNSLCVMCSQPPREVDEPNRVAQLLRTISLIDQATDELGITGGEPTLLGAGLLDVIQEAKTRLPNTALHVLSNGRAFLDTDYSRRLGSIQHPNLMIGVPLYSDLDSIHDFVVQCKGAFGETVLGLHNLARFNVPVEIRIVIQRHTAARLVQLADFIYRNMTFAAHVAFMGLEIIGFAKGNLTDLWVPPQSYVADLSEAVNRLAIAGLTVSVYNHQLCAVPPSLWPFCRKSISDWKNEFLPECDKCAVKADCGGFFAWNLDHAQARFVMPITSAPRA